MSILQGRAGDKGSKGDSGMPPIDVFQTVKVIYFIGLFFVFLSFFRLDKGAGLVCSDVKKFRNNSSEGRNFRLNQSYALLSNLKIRFAVMELRNRSTL